MTDARAAVADVQDHALTLPDPRGDLHERFEAAAASAIVIHETDPCIEYRTSLFLFES